MERTPPYGTRFDMGNLGSRELYEQSLEAAKPERPLSDEEQQSLFDEWKITGDLTVRDRLVHSVLPFVLYLARKYKMYEGDIYDELVAEGSLAVAQALGKYEPSKGKLRSFMGAYIEGYMKSYLTARKSTIRTSTGREGIKITQNLSRVIRDLTKQLGVEPTNAQIAAQLGVTEEGVQAVRNAHTTLSVDTPMREGDGDSSFTLRNVMASLGPSPETAAINSELARLFEEFAATLGGRDLIIFRERLMKKGGNDPRTLQDLSNDLKISRERVRKVEIALVGKFRVFLSMRGIDVDEMD